MFTGQPERRYISLIRTTACAVIFVNWNVRWKPFWWVPAVGKPSRFPGKKGMDFVLIAGTTGGVVSGKKMKGGWI
jgi:hypothetical protein